MTSRRPRITTAGAPSRGRGFLGDVLADGRCVAALGSGSQSGFELDYELADGPLRALASAAADGDVVRGYDAIAALLGEMRRSYVTYEYDDGLPMLTAIVAVCSANAAEVSWIGNDKAYLIRDRTIIDESAEHTHWRSGGRPEWAELMAKLDPSRPPDDVRHELFRHALGCATRTITADGGAPDRVRFDVEPGDALLLISGSLYRRIGWRAGIERALARASVVEAEEILQEARAIAFELGTGEEYLAWTGPVVMVRW